MKNEVEQIALQNDMSIEFVTWFFNEKKAGCGNVWFMMMAAMWEGWKGRSIEMDKLATENMALKAAVAEEIEVITGLVENGFGISVLPYMDIVRLHNVVTIPVKTSGWNSKFYIARRKYGIRSEQEEAFFQYWRT